jgi:pimeloyl-ACP methyl ester carboxylesterase
MGSERIQYADSTDGVRIAGRVDGHGPPLVLVHGAVADGESEFGALVPLLTDRFTCYRPSTRGRGYSDDHPDHSGTSATSFTPSGSQTQSYHSSTRRSGVFDPVPKKD